ncbi:MAG: T9SS type A sorting domain-containing protein [Candidatus Fermentibacteraceae bacterium]|nr:T9SS type A sorting domain-containing protein [Candidatus Fermentibacteraceae bacterium]
MTTGLYDTSGRLVSRTTESFYSPGSHTVIIDTENLPSGVYILRLATDGTAASQACVLLR